MKINRPELKDLIMTFMDVFKREGIAGLVEQEQDIQHEFRIDGSDSVIVEKRPSNRGSYAMTVSYVREGTGIPVELKFNSALNYVLVTVKMSDRFPGYAPFMQDSYGNLAQSRRLEIEETSAVQTALTELESLLR